jgi:hypothetical protein
MRWSREGMAGIFDAFVFLAIASLVSVSLLAAFSAPSLEEGEEQQRVEDSLTVLLRTTVKGADSNAQVLQEVFLMSKDVGQEMEVQISMTLDLLLPGWDWRWSVHRSGTEIAVVSISPIVPEGTVYCSIVRQTFHGEVVEYRLEAWLR